MLTSHSKDTGRKYNMKLVNRSFDYVAKLKYLGTTITDRNWKHEAVNSRLNPGNACCHSGQSSLPPPAVYEVKG
jgi:hypothetical protein